MKRLCDILFSGIGLLCMAPLFAVIALWIKCDSPGPVFYRQTRVGRGNKPFSLYKFRSMRPDADKAGLLTVGEHDNRVTKSGFFIRKYKLDEFPQLINVFIGDMSLVGPRPEVRKYVDMYTPAQLHVLDVRPGITDAASIKYRNENDLLAKADKPEQYYIDVIMQDKLRINLEYVKHHTLFGDLRLILSTFHAVLMH